MYNQKKKIRSFRLAATKSRFFWSELRFNAQAPPKLITRIRHLIRVITVLVFFSPNWSQFLRKTRINLSDPRLIRVSVKLSWNGTVEVYPCCDRWLVCHVDRTRYAMSTGTFMFLVVGRLRDWTIFMGERGPVETGRGPIHFVTDILKGPVLFFDNIFSKT